MPVEKVTISGFMILKNVVSQGYPFIEAIIAALPICDEFLISEGYSSDKTWEALQILERKFPGKVRLFRDEWRGKTERGEILATMTNLLKQRCTGSYCLYVQANEIIHESSLEEIKNLPVLYPDVEMFRLPFYSIMGSRLLWIVDFRRRLFKNKEYIISKGDAYDVGYDPKRFMFRPRKLRDYLLYAKGEHTYYLPQPFYRYRAIFPVNYLKKLESRADLYGRNNLSYMWNKEYMYAKNVFDMTLPSQSSELFWQDMQAYFDGVMWQDLPPSISPTGGAPRRSIRKLDDNPKIMNHLLDKWEYDLQDSLNMLRSAGDGGISASTVEAECENLKSSGISL
jgi:hypothetical protein